MFYYGLAVILATLCAIIGILGLGLIGYELLGLLGVRRSRLRLQLAALVFALPAGIAGAWIGYDLWTGMNML